MTTSILLVVISHDQLGDTGKATGDDLSEVSHPGHVFIEVGYTVDFVSPSGGRPPVDPNSLHRNDPLNAAFLDDERTRSKMTETLTPAEVNAGDSAAIFFADGAAPVGTSPTTKGCRDSTPRSISAAARWAPSVTDPRRW